MAGKMTKMYKTLAKDTGLFAISRFASKLLVFFLTPLYTYVLTTEDFGIANLITTTIHFIYPVMTLAISEATLRYAFEKGEDQSAVLNNSLLITVLATAVLCLAYPLVAPLNETIGKYWLIFVLNFTLFNLQECVSNFLKGTGQKKLFAIQGVIHTMTIIVCNVLFLLVFQKGLDGYLWSIVIGHTAPIVFMTIAGKLHRHWKGFKLDKRLLGEMLKYSIPMIPTLLAWAANTSIDKYMIIGFLGISESGIYGVAHKIPSILTAVLAIFSQAWQLSVISNHGSEEEEQYYTNVYKGLNFASLLVCMVIIGSAEFAAKILYAKDFYTAWHCVPFLTVAAMFASNSGVLAAAFRAAKKTKGLFVSVLCGMALNVLLNIFLIRQLGIIGAAIGTAAGFAALWVSRVIMIQKIVRVRIGAMKTAVEYLLLFLAAAWITFELPYAYVVFALAFAGILAMNLKQIRSVAAMTLGILRKKRKP